MERQQLDPRGPAVSNPYRVWVFSWDRHLAWQVDLTINDAEVHDIEGTE